MLVFLLAPVIAFAQPAELTSEGARLVSAKRDAEAFRAAVEPVLTELGECAAHTSGLDYGALTVSFMIDHRGATENISVRSDYLLPRDLVKCMSATLEDENFGRGDVAVAKLIVTLPTETPEVKSQTSGASVVGNQPNTP
ncbi:MAG: hypothetical protein EP330_04915 [Deltaproteobacteria bacterium]|nr:MAG: hypothetical protein EP330_04915 [Deltaproteobacteria bacterium]